MSRCHGHSAPELIPSCSFDDNTATGFEGVSVNVKLLLKLIQDHNEGSPKDDDNRRRQRVAGMMSIIEDVKNRIEKSQMSSKVKLRRCNTEIKQSPIPKDKKPPEPGQEEIHKLRKELSANLAAQKSLQRMFSSLGKEKEIMAAELALKVHQLQGMEEDFGDLRAQNEMLLEKVKTCAAEHTKEKRTHEGNAALQERNEALSEQLLKSLDHYRSLKRKLKDAQEENTGVRGVMAGVVKEVSAGLGRIHAFRQSLACQNETSVGVKEELSAVERMFQGLKAKVTIGSPKRGDCGKLKTDIPGEKSPVLT